VSLFDAIQYPVIPMDEAGDRHLVNNLLTIPDKFKIKWKSTGMYRVNNPNRIQDLRNIILNWDEADEQKFSLSPFPFRPIE
jgi:hypothetical protein